MMMINHGRTAVHIEHGDRIAQLVFAAVHHVQLTLEPVSDTIHGGFGSTGR